MTSRLALTAAVLLAVGFLNSARASEASPRVRTSLPGAEMEVASNPETGSTRVDIRVPAEEGIYRVAVDASAAEAPAAFTFEAEARRRMLPPQSLGPGESSARSFTVWRLSPKLADGGEIKMTYHDVGTNTYDELLTLSIESSSPCIDAVSIEPVDREGVLTVFLAGDSTVTDQAKAPWSSWGAMLASHFTRDVAVANFASSGRSLRSFRAERRLDKLLELLRPGDYVLIQFGHNDQKESGEGIGPFESYSEDLADYVHCVRRAGGHPVLVTPMVRRRFDRDGHFFGTLEDYAEAVRRVASAEDVPLIDLNAMSRKLVEAAGPDGSKRLYVHVAAGTYPDQTEAIKDDTHFSEAGGASLADLVVDGIRSEVPGLSPFLRP
ncbi:MAG: rhamnogalacturonan acetylesterase [Phycisphaeraceae bacterium]|nr:MAG: rhamnogalacturonan acetylesterase [Phycisphaeraceae bacterium]